MSSRFSCTKLVNGGLHFSTNSVATLGVLTVVVKAWSWFKVASSVSSKFAGLYGTKAPSFVFLTERLARDLLCKSRIALAVVHCEF